MPQNLIQRLEKRINSVHKGSFWATLKVEGDHIHFNESSREHTYALRAEPEYLEQILNATLSLTRIYTIIVKMKDGALQVLKVV